MASNNTPKWIKWAREIQALSQTGLAYAKDDYQVERYERLAEIAAEILQSHSKLDKINVFKNFMNQIGYATPKVDGRGAVVHDGKILLVQERADQKWCLPGGWADVGDKPSEMVVREVLEESGFHVKVKKIVGVYDANRGKTPQEFYHCYKIIFLCDIMNGEAKASNETMDVQFFDFDNLPPLSSERTNERHLNDVLAHIKDMNYPAVFD